MRRLVYIVLVTLAMLAGGARASCEADLDGDGQIALTDLLDLLGQWGPCVGCDADLDGDGQVATGDLLAVLSAWGPCLQPGGFPEAWISGGPDCPGEQPIQVHQYNDDLYILRQSLCTNFEAPFMYLIFGEDRVLMQDTGAGGITIGETVYGIIDDWLVANGRTSIELIVSHSHSHGDHLQGDRQFTGQPRTSVVGTSTTAVSRFFGFADWPNDIVEYDLGGRIIDVIAIPGHESAHIALFDRCTGLLFTGDTLYPGRLYISDFNSYVESIQRLVGFVAERSCSWVLGTHIEMTSTPGVDFGFGVTHHPNEHPLQLTRDHLQELLAAVIDMQASPHIEVHDDFIVWPF